MLAGLFCLVKRGLRRLTVRIDGEDGESEPLDARKEREHDEDLFGDITQCPIPDYRIPVISYLV